jgi:phage terminase small subunit
MKKADLKKEEIFVREYVATGNATESAKLSGYGNNSGQMGYYLKNKLKADIDKGLREVLDTLTPKSISVMQNMLESNSDSVKLATCKYILTDLNGYGKNEINMNIDYAQQQENHEMDLKLIDRLAESFDYLTKEDITKIFETNPEAISRFVECIKIAKLNQHKVNH